MIDKKDRTISELRSKLRLNESRSIMKSNMMNTDTLLNFRIGENTDIGELKKILIQLISDTKQTQETLALRCNKVREMLDLYEARIQFDDMLFLKEKDVNRMNEHIKHLT